MAAGSNGLHQGRDGALRIKVGPAVVGHVFGFRGVLFQVG